MIRQAALLCETDSSIQEQHLFFTGPAHLPGKGVPSPLSVIHEEEKSLKEMVSERIEAVEKAIIGKVLAEADGNKSEAARKLGMDYKTLLRKIKHFAAQS